MSLDYTLPTKEISIIATSKDDAEAILLKQCAGIEVIMCDLERVNSEPFQLMCRVVLLPNKKGIVLKPVLKW